MRADRGHVSASMHAAVSIYYVVVAYTFPAALLVPAVYIGHCVVAALWGRATVYYNLRYLSHTNIRFGVGAVHSSCARTALALFQFSA